MAEGSGSGVLTAFGAVVGTGRADGAEVGTVLAFGCGAAVGGTFTATAKMFAGALVGTIGGSGAGETAICACVGTGLGAAELTGAGVGLGGAVGANFANS